MGSRGFKIATIGSHSALQILRGAKDEGFGTIAVCEKERDEPYRHFGVADRIILLDSFKKFMEIENDLISENSIVIPHGTFLDAVTTEKIELLKVPYFGNKKILKWEVDRAMQREWLRKAGLTLPRIFRGPDDIDVPAIIKFYGAKGGKGFFLAKSRDEFDRKIEEHKGKAYIIQEYIVGAPIYIHYFYSPLSGEIELMSFDKRYESNVDSIGRIAAKDQLDMGLDTSYNITGNVPLVVRESLLPKIFEMGRAVIEASKKIEKRGIFGPFSLETVITPDLKFYVFEISARIVAGTNHYISGSPYTALKYKEPMSTGRRISREIRNAIASDQLCKVLG
ncbi:formate--phosphoribosylaminoimidazolecarboxamide ligase [Candidatus Woesearchaeota archaeon]|nr:formate--phosphoribosylaminoimidazolecarboxamide ligase [Candidatus Woesearchaeota archaeon]